MRTTRTDWLVILVCFAAAACAGSPDPVARGKAVFNGFGCVRCHSIGGEGGSYAPDLTYIGFRKTSEWLDLWLKNPHAWRNQTVMPNFHLTDDLRASLVAFLSAQQGQAFGSNPPWNVPELQGDLVMKGEKIFDKAGCVACHGQRGRGGYPNNNVAGGLIPSLSKVFETYTKAELKTRVANGKLSDPKDPSQPPPMIRMPVWKEKLGDAELDAVVEYLFSLKPKGGAGKSEEW